MGSTRKTKRDRGIDLELIYHLYLIYFGFWIFESSKVNTDKKNRFCVPQGLSLAATMPAGNRVEHGGSGSEEGWRAHGGEDERSSAVVDASDIYVMPMLNMYEHGQIACIILHVYIIYIYIYI